MRNFRPCVRAIDLVKDSRVNVLLDSTGCCARQGMRNRMTPVFPWGPLVSFPPEHQQVYSPCSTSWECLFHFSPWSSTIWGCATPKMAPRPWGCPFKATQKRFTSHPFSKKYHARFSWGVAGFRKEWGRCPALRIFCCCIHGSLINLSSCLLGS